MSRSLLHATRTVRTEPGLVWASVVDHTGRRYMTDEFNHRVVVEEPSGRTWCFGQEGSGAGDLLFPRGLAVMHGVSAQATRVFVADTWNHRVQVFDGAGRLVFGFGREGDGPGQFRAPADVIVARPDMPWEGERGVPEAPSVLVVADQCNARLQVFARDGVWLATLGGRKGDHVEEKGTPRGWPFFRMGEPPVPRDPVRLSWNAPWLTVDAGNGRASRFDLAAALLPSFDEWVASAERAERARACRYFSLAGNLNRVLPPQLIGLLSSSPDLV